MAEFIDRVKVIARTAVTWLVFASVLLTAIAGELADLLPGNPEVTTFIMRVVAWITAAITIIRRVTPVAPDERGVLEQN